MDDAVDVEGVRGLQIDGERVRVRARTGASLPRYEYHLTPVRTTLVGLPGPTTLAAPFVGPGWPP